MEINIFSLIIIKYVGWDCLKSEQGSVKWSVKVSCWWFSFSDKKRRAVSGGNNYSLSRGCYASTWFMFHCLLIVINYGCTPTLWWIIIMRSLEHVFWEYDPLILELSSALVDSAERLRLVWEAQWWCSPSHQSPRRQETRAWRWCWLTHERSHPRLVSIMIHTHNQL